LCRVRDYLPDLPGVCPQYIDAYAKIEELYQRQ
jgi:hypothetical protein